MGRVDGFFGGRWQAVLFNDLPQFLFRKEGEDRLTRARGVHLSAAAGPGDHPHGLAAFDLGEANDLAVILDIQARRLATVIDQRLHDWPGETRNVTVSEKGAADHE